ncbi:MAG: S-adenosylmethionine:tRNA ribosyltransferase-isomerase [Actinomycetota bacterium]|nr:S-adenosylmethionine:tRNA ribosyltransferase-isomerase [Actinomycetota bacterium]
MDISKFSYNLPSGFIAQKPLAQRDKAKLMVLDRSKKDIRHDYFFNLGHYLKPNDCLVLNESKVQKCRLMGTKENTGARIECFVLEKIRKNSYLVLLKPSKRLEEGTRVSIGEHWFVVKNKKDKGKAIVEFDTDASVLFEKARPGSIAPLY